MSDITVSRLVRLDDHPSLVLIGSDDVWYTDRFQSLYFRSSDPDALLRQYLKHIMRYTALRVIRVWLVRHRLSQSFTEAELDRHPPAATYRRSAGPRGRFRLEAGVDVGTT